MPPKLEAKVNTVLTCGPGSTINGSVVAWQPVPVSVNVKVAEPGPAAVTTPLLVTVATEVLLLLHVPPLAGLNVVVSPTQRALLPVMDTDGGLFTVTVHEAVAVQPPAPVTVTE